jgi:hypothetical protein
MANELTIFDGVERKEVQKAILNLINGKTPISEVRKLPTEAGGYNYVNGYYMTRQLSLITGFRWSSECLEEVWYPSKEKPDELGAKMKVTIWDKDGNQYSHISWGAAKVKPKISIFDEWKSAYTDGIKKCLSYFGIANDVYGGRDLDYFGEEPQLGEEQTADMSSSPDMAKAFIKFINDKHILPSKAAEMLGVKALSEITDWRDAYNKVKTALGGAS